MAVRCNRLCYCIRGLPLSQAASPFYGTLPRFGGAFSCVFPPCAVCNQRCGSALGWWACCPPERTAGPVDDKRWTHLSPASWWGFCLAPIPLRRMGPLGLSIARRNPVDGVSQRQSRRSNLHRPEARALARPRRRCRRQFTHLRLSAGSQQNCGAKATRRYFEDNASRKRVSIRRKRGIFKSHRGARGRLRLGRASKRGRHEKWMPC